MKIIVFSIVVLTSFLSFSQNNDSLNTKNTTDKGKLFSNIYPGMRLNLSTSDNKAGFVLTTALIGYKRTLAKNVTGTIIYDVTRTTNNIQVTDSNGVAMNVNYFEGSRYTAFLKMAEIKWKFHKMFTLSAGQLLNTQYLTLQDKFWGHRYVEVTFQELYRFGNPADFGMRLKYEPNKKLAIYAGAFNGEGPFRHQDEHANFLVSGNIEYRPIKELILKVYYANHIQNTTDTLNNKEIISAFAGYKNKVFMIGAEYNYVKNADFYSQVWSGFSGFMAYNITDKYEVFYRYDYVDKSKYLEYSSYHIVGVQYKPIENFFTSVNYRFHSVSEYSLIYLNFGLKF